MIATKIILLILAQELSRCVQTVIPLSYALDPEWAQKKYPIKFSFLTSQTTAPFSSQYLPLFNFNISMQIKKSAQSQQYVYIGLQYPSVFLVAVQQTFKVEQHNIEIGIEEYVQLIINGNNFVESTDVFVNGDLYQVKALQNYGEPLFVSGQRTYLIDGQDVYFDQYLILQILNRMDKKNNISYKQNPSDNTIEISGNLENFPQIQFRKDKSIFEVQINKKTIRYLVRKNSNEARNYIGYKSLTKFSKFQMLDTNVERSLDEQPPNMDIQTNKNRITFKRTSQLYQLYIFLAYFFIFTLVFLIKQRLRLEQSMKFVKSVVDWVIFQNRQARINVLRTELQ